MTASEQPATESALSPEEVVAWLARRGLADGPAIAIERLSGGVSSDIWRVEFPGRSVCVKRALARLRVARVWEAPIERNRFEWEWFREVGTFLPDAVPRMLAFDSEAAMFAMEYLQPATHVNWKAALSRGEARPEDSRAVARRLAVIHSRTAFQPRLAEAFATDSLFHALRLEPYLVATAERHPDLAPQLTSVVETTAAHRHCLVHGDVSPKNILLGPRGPIFLDAECAWYGDPAFDVAFCLNHLLLKCLLRPDARPALRRCFMAFVDAYLAGVTGDLAEGLEARAARLLSGLLLARVDGKSPVEYITTDEQRDIVRGVARPLLLDPVNRLDEVAGRWHEVLQGTGA